MILGKGAFGIVQKGIHKVSKFAVAIKTYEKKLLTNKIQQQMVQREIDVLQQLKHENVAELYEVIDTPMRVHLVMELCDGRNLYQHMKKQDRKFLTEQEAVPVFRQILSAVDFMHSQGLVHRDLKLENILISDEKVVKIIDFGFAT